MPSSVRSHWTPSRRTFVTGGASFALAAGLPRLQGVFAAEGRTQEFDLHPAPGKTRLVPEAGRDTAVWAYDGVVPGPELRVRQGERLRVTVRNGLEEETTVHWHGIRLPNAMDGVPHLTQKPIGPGESFEYEFELPDAGTYWYHPHQRSFEQVGRGLYGPLIVEEADPVRVDRDVTWMLDDWRLTRSAEIRDDFGNRHDMSHNGRVGDTVTINGSVPDSFAVNSGERIRLRLVNAANARVFALDFGDHDPHIIALDGQPVTPHAPESGLLVLGPAMRADIILDMTGKPGSRVTVVDRFYRDMDYRLVDLAYGDTPLRDETPDWPMALLPNPLPEPDVADARRHEVVFSGGMMGGMVLARMGLERQSETMGMMGMMRGKGMWFVNGVAAEGHVLDPILTLERGESHVIRMVNATAWHHPIHLHGHSFRVISRDGAPTTHREWQDTVLMAPQETVEIAFVADNPGDWMFHCHILEHQAAGMTGVIRVA